MPRVARWHSGCDERHQGTLGVLTNFSEFIASTARAHRRVFVASVISLAVLIWGVTGAVVWLLGAALTGLPDDTAILGVGAMSSSTTLLDVHDRPAFTIFKEQRIEVPLSLVSPSVIDA